MTSTYVLTLTAEDRVGIVADVTGFLAERDGFILDSQQYADLERNRFFMRVEFKPAGPGFPASLQMLRDEFTAVAERNALRWQITDSAEKSRIVLAVSKGSHCLNHLLHRWRTGTLPVEIVAVVSNHDTLRDLTEWHNVPFHHFPIGPDNRAAQEELILDLFDDANADLLVLARYMQILSEDMAKRLSGRCINIHHGFLPAFKGAQPYHRAHDNGVKLIGATAHYVTADLDEGPIIEQAVERVDHRDSVDEMIRIGRDIEAQVLAKAVQWAAENRILLNGKRTVVFR